MATLPSENGKIVSLALQRCRGRCNSLIVILHNEDFIVLSIRNNVFAQSVPFDFFPSVGTYSPSRISTLAILLAAFNKV